MDDFHKTRMGAIFFNRDIPRIADALERIAKALETNQQIEVVKKEVELNEAAKSFIPERKP